MEESFSCVCVCVCVSKLQAMFGIYIYHIYIYVNYHIMKEDPAPKFRVVMNVLVNK